MVKKMMLLAAAAGAIVAFAAPAAAQAAHFYDEGGPIPGGQIIETYEGEYALRASDIGGSGVSAGIACPEAFAEISYETESAQMISFVGLNCIGTDAFADCAIREAGVPGLVLGVAAPWAIGEEGSELFIKGIHTVYGFDPGCQLFGETISGAENEGTITVTPTEGNVGELMLSGTINTVLGPARVSGSLTAVNPNTQITFEP